MRWICQATAFCFVALSAFVVWESWNLEYYTNLGPGGGFFPLWLGAFMGGLSLAWLYQVSGRKASTQDVTSFPDCLGILRILSTIAALVAMAAFRFGTQERKPKNGF